MIPLLPPLSPIAPATADGESLSSYAMRVAASEGILPGQLVSRVLAWVDQKRPEMIGRWCRRPQRVRIGFNNNCFAHANVWLRLMQRLTGRADLEPTTTARWDCNFPTRHFQRSHLAWCPLCLSEDPQPYHRLLWMLQPVRVCIRHNALLTKSCPQCGHQLPVIHERSTVVMCPRCTGDLRLTSPPSGSGQIHDYDLWVANELGGIIAASVEWHKAITWSPKNAFESLALGGGIASVAQFARLVGTSKITAWYWLSGKARPSLPMALHAFHRFGSSLATALDAQSPAPPRQSTPFPQGEFHLRPIRRPVKRDWQRVSRLLRAELSRQSGKTRSLTALAHDLKIDRRTLRAHFPSICRRIAARNKLALARTARLRDKELLHDIRAAIRELEHLRIPVTPHNVARRIGHPGLFSRHNARAAYLSLRLGR